MFNGKRNIHYSSLSSKGCYVNSKMIHLGKMNLKLEKNFELNLWLDLIHEHIQ